MMEKDVAGITLADAGSGGEGDELLLLGDPGGRSRKEKVVIAAVLAAVALVSLLLAVIVLASPESYGGVYSTLDEKKDNVMALAATTTVASAGVSALPGDTGTPIAEKLIDFSSYFMVILGVIYLEKFLLTTLGFLGFGILVPVACVLFAAAVFARGGSLTKKNLRSVGAKLAAFGVAIALVVPVSVWLTNSVDGAFDASLDASAAAVQEATQELEESAGEGTQQENHDFFSGIASAVQGGLDELTWGVQDTLDDMGRELNTLTDTIAVMIVTSCLIPLLVLIVFLQLVKLVTGIDVGGASAVMGLASKKGRATSIALKSTLGSAKTK